MSTKIVKMKDPSNGLIPDEIDLTINFQYDESIVRICILEHLEFVELRDLIKAISSSDIGTVIYSDNYNVEALENMTYGTVFYCEAVSFSILEKITQDFSYNIEINEIQWIDENYQIV